MSDYDHKSIEKKWQEIWEKEKTFRADDNSKKPKWYSLIEFPYPSGNGLHIGHIRPNTAMDIISRKRRMEGFNVLYPIGWDAFGLPTENYAIKNGIHPEIVTKENTDKFREQLKKLGFTFDWEREINTTDPEYYKWTQWIFLQMFKAGLAYKKKMPINWCLSCKIGLANEEVVTRSTGSGQVAECERCGGEVEKREKEQWMLGITKYADRLEKDLEEVDFLPQIKLQQKNWIGRSEGAKLRFKIYDLGIKNELSEIEVFTTRPDTLFGVTYIVLAPESDYTKLLLDKISNKNEVLRYIENSKNKSEIERTSEEKEKTGIEMKGVVAINPANNEQVPIYVADYVLAGYGTGAVMAVPAHDERDFEFAKKYNLEIREVVKGGELPFVENGIMVNSGEFNGMKNEEAKWEITEFVGGKKTTTYKLRDWVFSRQRYWGEPIPIIHCENCAKRKYNFIFIHGFKGSVREVFWPWLRSELEKTGHSVSALDLPNPNKPKTLEQAEFILKNNKFDENTILIGHSLGSVVIYRILEKLKTKIAKAIFVDPVVSPDFNDHDRLTVKESDDWQFDFEKIKQGVEDIVILADNNFPIIKKEHLQELGSKLGVPVNFAVVQDDHFCAEKEPEILKIFENLGYIPVSEKDLPIKLPHVDKYEPTDTGESPLSVISDWVNVKCPRCGSSAKRETDTMPNWAGSSWYYLRYMDPNNKKEFANRVKLNYWSPVDWYNGGMEHVTLHLLYSRFWHKFLYDQNLVPTKEPYKKRTTHGLILAEGGVKMSKSKGNVINPDEIVERFGADSLRLYEMFMGPFDQAITWSLDGLVGSRRFLEKVWRISNKINESKETNKSINFLIQKTIKKVSDDIEEMKFNTAVSALMILLNEIDKNESISKDNFGQFLILLSPFAPHLTEELWQELRFDNQIINQKWPKFNPNLLQEEKVKIVVQINGKVRGEFLAESNIDEKQALKIARENPDIEKWLDQKEIKKTIFVKGRLLSIVIT